MGSVVASQPGLWFKSWLSLRPFCVEFACFPCVCVGGFPLGALVSPRHTT